MRRLTLAALSAALVLTACSDREPTTAPPEPTPEETFDGTCQVARFPLLAAVAQIKIVFPKGRLQLEAIARAGAIKLLWDTCKPTLARKGVFLFLDWMNRNSSGLNPDTDDARNELTRILFTGVGLSAPPPISLGPDFGTAFLDGSSAEVVTWTTTTGQAAGAAQKNAFGDGVSAVVTTSRLPNSFQLLFTPPPSPAAAGLRALELALQEPAQFPPYYDYNVSTPTGNHIVVNGTLLVGFCLEDDVAYPDGIQIGHNPVQINEGQPSGLPFFEVLPAASATEYDQLVAAGLACPEQVNEPPPLIGLDFHGGLPDLAFSAWRTAKHYVGPVMETLFLPSSLRAAQVTVAGISGKTRSFSPFGVVDMETNEIQSFGTDVGDEGAGPYFAGQPLDTCNDGCRPAFKVVNPDGGGVSGVAVTVSLLPAEGSIGELDGTTTLNTSESGVVEFSDLTISEPGSYQLVVSASGAASYTTGVFNVSADPATTLFSVSSFGVDVSKRGSLYTLNSNTGVVSFVGRLSANPALYTIATNMAVRLSDQKIFVWSNSNGVLLTVDPNTGLGTPVDATTPPQGLAVQALAFSPTGALYGIADGAVEGFLSNLVSVNPSTGVATVIGPLGSGLRVSGADFACNGTLYGLEFSTTSSEPGVEPSSRLVTIDLETGAATVIAELSGVTAAQSIVFMPSGTLVGSAGNLFDINLTDGTVSNIRSLSATDVTPQGLGIARTCEPIIN